jgi:hypothetical protein
MNVRQLIIIPLFLIAVSCTNKIETIVSGSDKESSSNSENSLSDLLNIIDGNWISDDYLSKIENSKAILTNTPYNSSLLGFSVLKDSLADGNDYLYGYTAHDAGSTWPIYYNTAKSRLEYDIKKSDGNDPPSTFHVSIVNDKTLDLVFADKKIRYRKTDLDTALRQILFEGTYTDAHNRPITFSADGSITGLDNYTFYRVQFDPDGEEGIPFDGITLYKSEKEDFGKTYHFKIHDKALVLYNVSDPMTEDEIVIKDIACTFTKHQK